MDQRAEPREAPRAIEPGASKEGGRVVLWRHSVIRFDSQEPNFLESEAQAVPSPHRRGSRTAKVACPLTGPLRHQGWGHAAEGTKRTRSVRYRFMMSLRALNPKHADPGIGAPAAEGRAPIWYGYQQQTSEWHLPIPAV